MEFELTPNTRSDDRDKDAHEGAEGSAFRISARPLIANPEAEVSEGTGTLLPRSYGAETLTLMARDPHSIFAYWDLDWPSAFRDQAPHDRKVHLRILSSDGAELVMVEIEPMAGSCEVTVPKADAAYEGELGYFLAGGEWHSLLRSALITTPPEAVGSDGEVDFATVPFHLSFQRMIDLLRISKQENESLLSMLANLRGRAASPGDAQLNAGEREVAEAMHLADADPAEREKTATGSPDFWTQEKLERILGFGTSSPTEGFGGSSRAS